MKKRQNIPKIIHQIWLGPKERPQKWLDTWKEKNPEWEYRLWTEENIPPLENQKQFDLMQDYAGKADILRYELLYRYGGFYLDADSECLLPLSDSFLHYHLVTFYEHEEERPGLICQCVFGCEPFHPVMKRLIDTISTIKDINQGVSWITVGPLLFTKIVNAYQSEGHKVPILPSHLFCPLHFSGRRYSGRGKVFAMQHWSTTKEKGEQLDRVFVEAYSDYQKRKHLQRKEESLSKRSIHELISLWKELHISRVLDAPCGDFSWLKDERLPLDSYIGIDFSSEIILHNQKLYENRARHFECLDLVQHSLPKVDMILCRDYFQHLSYEEIYAALCNFAKSRSRYLMATLDETVIQNDPEQTLPRPVNLLKPPFNFPSPIRQIHDGNKVLALWNLNLH